MLFWVSHLAKITTKQVQLKGDTVLCLIDPLLDCNTAMITERERNNRYSSTCLLYEAENNKQMGQCVDVVFSSLTGLNCFDKNISVRVI